MLDSDCDPPTLSEQLDACPCEIELPPQWSNFFAETGVAPTYPGDGRRFPRFHVRSKGALESRQSLPMKPRTDAWRGIYLKNISREGLGFLYSEQLFPAERMRVVLTDGKLRAIKVVFCRRIQRRCYEIGARFVAEGDHFAAE